jgi:hypothetical protein
MYEETAAASQSLQHDAQTLAEIVATFRGHDVHRGEEWAEGTEVRNENAKLKQSAA